MALLSVIRRWHLRDELSIREISRRTGLSRNTIRKYLRSGEVEPRFKVPDRASKLDIYAERLAAWLRTEANRPRKQKRTIKQLHADLMSLGYDGSYGRVAAFARAWKADRQREMQTSGRGTFVPLAFEPGEAFQFDWSEDWAIIGGERTKLQVAHTKLSYSRAFVVRAYSMPSSPNQPRRQRRHLPLEGLSHQGQGIRQGLHQDHDPGGTRVHPPLPAPRAARRLPPHPPLWAVRQRHVRCQHRQAAP